MSIVSELKACPWCNETPKTQKDYIGDNRYESYIIYCDNRKCAVSPRYDARMKDLAIEYWNTRHPQQDVQGLAKALQDLLDDLKERAKWMHFEPQDGGTVLPCGNGVYVAAEQALKSYQEGRG